MRSILSCPLGAALLTLAGCSVPSMPVPREGYVPAATDFAKASDEVTKAAERSISSLRTERRLDAFRYAMTQSIVTGELPPKFLGGAFNIQGFTGRPGGGSLTVLETVICVPRGLHARAVGNVTYIGSYSTLVSSLSKPPADDFVELVKALRERYRPALTGPEDGKEAFEACLADMATYLDTVYPIGAQQEVNVVAIIAAAQSLYEIFNQIFKPLATAALKEINSARRAAALQTFLRDPENRREVAAAIERLTALIEREERRARHYKAKEVSVAFIEFDSALSGPGFTKGDIPVCKDAMPRDFATNPSEFRNRPQFQTCAVQLWAKWEPHVRKIISAGQEYDVEADRTPDASAAQLRSVSSKLDEIAEGRVSTETAALLLDTAVRWMQLAQDAKKTIDSKENQQKLDEALKKLREALRK